MPKLRSWIAFSSSSGETLEKVWKSLSQESREACLGLITDRNCKVLERECFKELENRALGLHAFSRKEFEASTLKLLAEKNINIEKVGVVGFLCGFFSILSAEFVEKFPGILVNTHPSLLPAFPGLDRKVHEEVFQKTLVSGFSVHMVDDSLDGGPLLYQEAVSILNARSADEVREAVRQCEQKNLHRVLERILRSELSKEDLKKNCSTLKTLLWKEPS